MGYYSWPLTGSSIILGVLIMVQSAVVLDEYSPEVHSFLESFGYLPKHEPGRAEKLQTNAELNNAIKNLQYFGGLPQTGKVDAATVQLIKSPRCGVPDIRSSDSNGKGRSKRHTYSGVKWDKNHITWNYDESSSRMDATKVRAVFRKSLSMWSNHSKLTFEEVSGDQADIRVKFARRYHSCVDKFDGRGGILAHAFIPYSSTDIGGDAHFDADEDWTGTKGLKALTTVAVHEFGHSLGLGHSPDRGSIMFPYYSKDRAFGQDDINGIQAIYGKVEPKTKQTSTTRRTTKRPATTPKSNPKDYPPIKPEVDICNMDYDAISMIQDNLYIFKNQKHWRFRWNGYLHAGYPFDIVTLWKGLPSDLSRIDSVYENNNAQIFFFIGKEYYRFKGDQVDRGFPKPLTSLGLPRSVSQIDAALAFSKDITFFFSGAQYWIFNETSQTTMPDSPLYRKLLRGINYPISSAFKHFDGKSYFIKNKRFSVLNDLFDHQEVSPTLSVYRWLSCLLETSYENKYEIDSETEFIRSNN